MASTGNGHRPRKRLTRREESFRQLSRRVLHAQEEERKRLSRELHDQVGGTLAAIHINLVALEKLAGLAPLVQKKLQDTQQLVEQTIEVVHQFSRELRPPMLDELGLLPALRSYIRSYQERTGLAVTLAADPVVETLGSEAKTVLYRVAQEGLTNTAKHAQARRVDLTLQPQGSGVEMLLHDDGKSFLPLGATQTRLGLLGARERVRLVQGEFTVQARPGEGTVLRVWIPRPKAPARRAASSRSVTSSLRQPLTIL